MKTTAKANDMTPGLKAMASRMDHAEANFIETLMGLGGIAKPEAERVLAYYRKHKLVKMDAVNGRLDVKHGVYLDADVIRRAVTA